MTSADQRWSCTQVVQWLMEEGRFLPDDTMVAEIGRRLVAAGAPVWRLNLSFQMLHPSLVASTARWTREDDSVHHFTVPESTQKSDAYIGGPVQYLIEHWKPLHQKIDEQSSQLHGLYDELYKAGYTDYFGTPVQFGGDSGGLLLLATKDSEGFSDADTNEFIRFSHYVAPVIESKAGLNLARSLLDTYVGRRTGEKVLRGMIRRGDSELINAALWFSDLRDFTHYTETLPAPQLLSMLNNYFECVSAAVTANGGEILRFIGDAMLIVFPVKDGASPREACCAALESARDALASIATLNHRRRRAGEPEINFGVGLNVGEVIYGNVGAPERLDFTVMGPAVNRAARLESLTKDLGETILMSRGFAEALDEPARACGTHAMKGIAEPQDVFAPQE